MQDERDFSITLMESDGGRSGHAFYHEKLAAFLFNNGACLGIPRFFVTLSALHAFYDEKLASLLFNNGHEIYVTPNEEQQKNLA